MTFLELLDGFAKEYSLHVNIIPFGIEIRDKNGAFLGSLNPEGKSLLANLTALCKILSPFLE